MTIELASFYWFTSKSNIPLSFAFHNLLPWQWWNILWNCWDYKLIKKRKKSNAIYSNMTCASFYNVVNNFKIISQFNHMWFVRFFFFESKIIDISLWGIKIQSFQRWWGGLLQPNTFILNSSSKFGQGVSHWVCCSTYTTDQYNM